MTTREATSSRLFQFCFHDGTTKLAVVVRPSKNFEFPFRMGLLGRTWLMVSRGSGGPQSIPIYTEVLQ